MKISNIFRDMILILFVSIFLIACGGGSSSSSSKTGILVDDIVEGVYYKSETTSGYTNSRGEFPFSNEKVEFFIGDIKIGEISYLPADRLVFIQDILGLDRDNIIDDDVINIAKLLQSIDSNPTTDEIEITRVDFNKFINVQKDIEAIDVDDILTERGFVPKSKQDVQIHLSSSFTKYNNVTFDQEEKDYLYYQLHNNYLWSQNVEEKPYSQYTDPNQMIDAFKYSTLDKWSYAETFNDYIKDGNQEERGFGCYFMGTPIITFIEIESPCEKAGFKRGDVLIQINNRDITNESYSKAKENIGVEVTFNIVRNDERLDIRITPQVYNYRLSKRYIYNSQYNKKVGYFIYNGFSSKSSDEIEEAFSYFKENEVDELIIDLRYNRGGSLAVASILLDKIAGFKYEDELQFYLLDNENNVESEGHFMKDDNSLDLSRILFLTSEDTASASELVINALKPYMDVVVIGDTTSGKPVGMKGKFTSSRYIYWLINFAIYNVNDEGEYYDGLDPNCFVYDNVSSSRGDIEESLLNSALYYIENDTCSYGNYLQSGRFTIFSR